MKKIIIYGFLFLLALSFNNIFAAEHYIAPLMKKAPPMNGFVGGKAWEGAVRFDGFTLAGSDTLEPRRVIGYIGATENNLYLGIVSEMPYKEKKLLAVERTNPEVVYNDAIEVWFTLYPENNTGITYQIIVDPAGDRNYLSHLRGNAIEASKHFGWQDPFTVVNGFHNGYWHCEIKVDINSVAKGMKATDGDWGINICRDFKNPWEFCSISNGGFSPGTSVVFVFSKSHGLITKFTNLKNPIYGNIDSVLSMKNPTDHSMEVVGKISLNSLNNKKKIPGVLEKKKFILSPGETAQIPLKFNNPSANNFILAASVVSPDGKKIYYSRKYQWEKPKILEFWAIKSPKPTVNKSGPVNLLAQYFPTYNLIYYKLIPNDTAKKISKLVFVLKDSKGKELFNKDIKLSTEEETLKIPYLKSTTGYLYSLDLYVTESSGKIVKSDTFKFERRHFAWENNTLGITNKVYPPFTPVKVSGNNVSVVLREYEMNGFGLWNKVYTKGKNILAGPVTINYTTKKGHGSWISKSGGFTYHNDVKAIYKSEAVAEPMKIKTTSTVYFDGAMKVNMEILPAGVKQEIENIYVDIPLKSKYVPLFHEVTDGGRQNYSGRLPEKKGIGWLIDWLPFSWVGLPLPGHISKEKGVVWNSTEAYRTAKWLDSFVSYIWLGGEERGLAFFGDNDKGWYTIKDGNKTPIQEIIRKGNEVILRIYLADHPVILKKPTSLVFGLDVSPTKPMPKNWRIKLPYTPGGLPVNAWGGLDCSYGTPYKNHWEIVDKIEEAREKGKVTKDITQWFEAFNKKYAPPPAYGTWQWLASVEWFANWNASVGPYKPIDCYTEEMDVNGVRKEWRTYLYEWTNKENFYNQYGNWLDYSVYRRGINAGAGVDVTWDKSERDYAVWIKNQWLKRGISLYWDNFGPHLSYNYRTTPAYIIKTGQIQPCVTIWEVRDYIMRVWNLLGYWRQYWNKRGTPLEFTIHMTNTLILPWDTFATADFDNELDPTIPIGPGYIRAEGLGRQVGNYSLTVHPLYGTANPAIKNLTDEEKNKIEWGMAMVHEIQRGPLWQPEVAKLENLVYGYGYGTKNVKVYNYWDTQPALQINNNKIKWIVLSKPKDNSMLIILSSYSKNQLSTPIKINYNVLNIPINGKITVTNVLTGKQENSNNIELSAPYGVDILKVQYQ